MGCSDDPEASRIEMAAQRQQRAIPCTKSRYFFQALRAVARNSNTEAAGEGGRATIYLTQ
jgi:hypothetical protein